MVITRIAIYSPLYLFSHLRIYYFIIFIIFILTRCTCSNINAGIGCNHLFFLFSVMLVYSFILFITIHSCITQLVLANNRNCYLFFIIFIITVNIYYFILLILFYYSDIHTLEYGNRNWVSFFILFIPRQ